MKQIVGINHVGIRVTSLERARGFYEQLGFVFLVGPIGPEPVAIMEHPSGVNINLILNADSGISDNILMDITERHPGYTHIALDVTDIEAIEDRLNPRRKAPRFDDLMHFAAIDRVESVIRPYLETML